LNLKEELLAKATKASTRKPSSKKASAKRSTASTGRAKAVASKSARKPAKKAAASKAVRKPAKKAAATKAVLKPAKKAAAKKAVRKPAKKAAATKAVRKPAKKAAAKKAVLKPAKSAVSKAVAKAVAKRAARKPAKPAVTKIAAGGGLLAAWSSVAKSSHAGLSQAEDQAAGIESNGAPQKAPAAFRRTYKTWLRRLIGLRRRLLGETVQLEEEALKSGEGEVSIDHLADPGTDSYEQEFTLSLVESKSEALHEVDEAIHRIEAGTYGLCDECASMIPKGRLEVLPHTPLCIECKSAQESASGF
jgi:RNA polymerase-binding transcription factor DksA